VDRLLEEGYNSTDIAAALFELLTGGSSKPEEVAETKPNKRDKVERSERVDDLPASPLRPASRGMRWVRLNVGREERISPRDIIGLLEDSLGLPMRSVGIIEIKPGQSFAQVPKQFLDVLRDGPRELETNAGAVEISLWGDEPSPKKKRRG
jgi:ATP-dependent RNA helicase DeaD